ALCLSRRGVGRWRLRPSYIHRRVFPQIAVRSPVPVLTGMCRRLIKATIAVLVPFACVGAQRGYDHQQDWTNYVRIAPYPLNRKNPEKIDNSAEADNVFGIEVDNDIPGRYESFLDPTAKLKAIREVAERAHHAGNHAFVYIAGTECITANADK